MLLSQTANDKNPKKFWNMLKSGRKQLNTEITFFRCIQSSRSRSQ